jgi:hypothetical protein
VTVDVTVEHCHRGDHFHQHVLLARNGRAVDGGECLGEAVPQPLGSRELALDALEVGPQRRLGRGVAGGEQVGDAFERQPRPTQRQRLVEPGDLGGAVAAMTARRPHRRDDAERVPVPQHAHRQAGGRSQLPHRPRPLHEVRR